jgi:hypothetical protein
MVRRGGVLVSGITACVKSALALETCTGEQEKNRRDELNSRRIILMANGK